MTDTSPPPRDKRAVPRLLPPRIVTLPPVPSLAKLELDVLAPPSISTAPAEAESELVSPAARRNLPAPPPWAEPTAIVTSPEASPAESPDRTATEPDAATAAAPVKSSTLPLTPPDPDLAVPSRRWPESLCSDLPEITCTDPPAPWAASPPASLIPPPVARGERPCPRPPVTTTVPP